MQFPVLFDSLVISLQNFCTLTYQRLRRICSCPQSTTSELLAEGMLQQREQREIKAIGKVSEAAREAIEGLPI